MSIRLILILSIFITLASCDSGENTFTVIGDIEQVPEQDIFLEEIGINDFVVIDSSRTKKDGSFELSGTNMEPGLYRLRFEQNKYVLLSIDAGNLKVTGNWKNLENYDVAGSAASSSLRKFLFVVREHLNDFSTMEIVMDSLRARNNDSMLAVAINDMRDMNRSFTMYIENYADTTEYLPNALFAAKMLNPQAEAAYMEAFIQNLPTRFPDSKLAGDFTEKFNQMTAMNNSPSAQGGLNVGSIAPNISLPTPGGEELSLQSLRGKYVLVDFWAAWCGPCRTENPNVVAAYEKYRSDKFTILGVSLDYKKEKWIEAIKNDNLTWNHVSDLKGWESIAARAYNVQAIPANFLIDPQGKIIARNLTKNDLHTKLAEVLTGQ